MNALSTSVETKEAIYMHENTAYEEIYNRCAFEYINRDVIFISYLLNHIFWNRLANILA